MIDSDKAPVIMSACYFLDGYKPRGVQKIQPEYLGADPYFVSNANKVSDAIDITHGNPKYTSFFFWNPPKNGADPIPEKKIYHIGELCSAEQVMQIAMHDPGVTELEKIAFRGVTTQRRGQSQKFYVNSRLLSDAFSVVRAGDVVLNGKGIIFDSNGNIIGEFGGNQRSRASPVRSIISEVGNTIFVGFGTPRPA